jgi:hypothetical protein
VLNASQRERGKDRRARAGRVVNKRKMAKHFTCLITPTELQTTAYALINSKPA